MFSSPFADRNIHTFLSAIYLYSFLQGFTFSPSTLSALLKWSSPLSATSHPSSPLASSPAKSCVFAFVPSPQSLSHMVSLSLRGGTVGSSSDSPVPEMTCVFRIRLLIKGLAGSQMWQEKKHYTLQCPT